MESGGPPRQSRLTGLAKTTVFVYDPSTHFIVFTLQI